MSARTDRLELAERPVQHRAADLRATATAAHGDRRDLLDRRGIGNAAGHHRLPRLRHLRQHVVFAHEAAIDPVLPPPHRAAFHRPTPPREATAYLSPVVIRLRNLPLRPEWPQRTSLQCAAQVVGERPALAHREHA